MKSYPAKLVGERRFATMNFAGQLAQIGSGITLVGCTVTIAVYGTGIDPSPQNILSGSTQISGAVAGQWLQAGVAGVFYIITWTATASDGSIMIRQRILPVVANWP